MMKSLFHALPTTIDVNGRAWGIYTDFREWMKFEQMLMDDISEIEKIGIMLGFFKPKFIRKHPFDIAEAIEKLIWFYRCGEDIIETPTNQNRAYDFENDSSLIVSAFYQLYKVDLVSIEHLHWWKFRSLLEGLTDSTTYGNIVYIRTVDVSNMPKTQKKEILKQRKKVAIEKKKKVMTAEERALLREKKKQEVIDRINRFAKEQENGRIKS